MNEQAGISIGSVYGTIESQYRSNGDRVLVSRAYAYGRRIDVFVHEDGRFTIFEGEEEGNKHQWLPMASGNLTTGERWAGKTFADREEE